MVKIVTASGGHYYQAPFTPEERELLGSLDGICESVSGVDRVPDLRPRPWSLDPTMMWYFDVPEMHRRIADSLRRPQSS